MSAKYPSQNNHSLSPSPNGEKNEKSNWFIFVIPAIVQLLSLETTTVLGYGAEEMLYARLPFCHAGSYKDVYLRVKV